MSGLENDLTTMLIQNHVVDMSYKGYLIVNLVSGVDQTKKFSEKLLDREIEDKLLKEVLNKKRSSINYREMGVGCDTNRFCTGKIERDSILIDKDESAQSRSYFR